MAGVRDHLPLTLSVFLCEFVKNMGVNKETVSECKRVCGWSASGPKESLQVNDSLKSLNLNINHCGGR